MKILLLLLISFNAHGFTLLLRNPARYPNEITIRTSDADCSNAGLTAQGLREFVERAVDDYWNSVPTSRAKFKLGPSITIPASSTTTQMIALGSVGEIIVGCSDNATTFPSVSTLAKGGMLTSEAIGVVAINDIVSTRFGTADELTRVSTFAHELGHAIGIGHSRVEYSLMYYAAVTGIVNKYLTEDDADAITYLYPSDKELAGLGGACGSIDLGDDDDKKGPGSFVLTLLLGFLITVVAQKSKDLIQL